MDYVSRIAVQHEPSARRIDSGYGKQGPGRDAVDGGERGTPSAEGRERHANERTGGGRGVHGLAGDEEVQRVAPRDEVKDRELGRQPARLEAHRSQIVAIPDTHWAITVGRACAADATYGD